MSRFLSFDKLVTPAIMKVLYIVGTVLIVLGTLIGAAVTAVGGIVAAVRMEHFPFALAALGSAVLYVILGLVGAVFFRIWCEVLVILFRIHEHLQAIRHAKD